MATSQFPDDDYTVGTSENDTIDGGIGYDHLVGGAGDDILIGGESDDWLIGGDGNDQLIGGDGNDWLVGSGGEDTLQGGLGDDNYVWTVGLSGAYGGEAEGDTVIADAGGVDNLRMMYVYDAVKLTRRGDDLLLSTHGKTLTVQDYFDLSENGGHIETIIAQCTVMDHRYVLDHLQKTPGEDTGPLPGDDPRPEADSDGDPTTGTKDDPSPETPVPPRDTPPIFTDGNDTLAGTPGEDTLFGGAGDDALSAAAADDFLEGGDGDDQLFGGSGADILLGNDGQDSLDGGAGTDLLKGGVGDDRYVWSEAGGNDTIGDAAGVDVLAIDGASTAARLFRAGDGGSDLVVSMGGSALTIQGYFLSGAENGYIETITFTDGRVWHMEHVLGLLGRTPGTNPGTTPGTNPNVPDTAPDTDTPDPAIPTTDTTDPDADVPGDSIPGGMGDDNIIAGGRGRDLLTGSEDADVFRFASLAEVGIGKKRDVIVDFERGTDTIDLGGIDANTKAAGDNAFTALLTGKKPFKKAGQLHYDKKTGILSGNTDKDAAAEFQIQLKNKPSALTLDDLIL